MKHIEKCDTYAKNLLIMAKYPQQHLEILQVPMAILAMNTIGHLPVTSRGHQWALTIICMHISHVFAITMKEKPAENVVQTYMSGIFTHKGGNIAILSDNGGRIQKHQLQWGNRTTWPQKIIFKPIPPQGNLRIENMHNFLKGTLNEFLEFSGLEWDELLPFAYYCYNIFPRSSGTKLPFFLMFGHDPALGQLSYLNNFSRYYRDSKGIIILAVLHKKWKHHAAYLKDIHNTEDDYTPCKSKNNTKFEICQAVMVKTHPLHF